MERLTVTRDCEVIQVPEGNKVILSQGSEVRLMQSLGGTFTVLSDWGTMFRIAAQDADAIGKKIEEIQPKEKVEKPLQELVWDQLKTCYDPEIPVNIVDLGLVYSCQVTPIESGGNKAEVKFTLTAPGCGMGDILKNDIETKVKNVPGVTELVVEVVVEPPWEKEMMSEAAKLQLGLI